jgi:hypothetical protein
MNMKQRLLSVMTVAIVAFGIGGNLAWAQQNTFKIPFEFHLGDNVLPAGTYEIKADGTTRRLLITNRGSGQTVFAGFLARIAKIDGNEAKLAFDKVGTKTYLCEIQYPDRDGYHLAGELGKHSHSIAALKKKN